MRRRSRKRRRKKGRRRKKKGRGRGGRRGGEEGEEKEEETVHLKIFFLNLHCLHFCLQQSLMCLPSVTKDE